MTSSTFSGSGSHRSEHAIHEDLDGNTPRVGGHRPISKLVGVDGLGHPAGIPGDDANALERHPTSTVDLAHGRPSGSFDVAHLLGAIRSDYPHQPGWVIDRESDGHDVRTPVVADRRERGEPPVVQEGPIIAIELVERTRHATAGYLRVGRP